MRIGVDVTQGPTQDTMGSATADQGHQRLPAAASPLAELHHWGLDSLGGLPARCVDCAACCHVLELVHHLHKRI